MNSHKLQVITNIKVFDENNNVRYEKQLYPSDTHDWMIGIKTDSIIHEQPMKSFNRNWPYQWFRYIIGISNNTVWNIDGNTTGGAVVLTAIAGSAGALDGICLGTGSRPISMFIYDLGYEIPASILTRSATTWVPPYVSGSTYEFGMYRTFVASRSLNITEMKLVSDTSRRNMLTYEKVDVSGSAINIAVPSGSTVTAWQRFNLDTNGPLTKNYLYNFYSQLRNVSVTLTSTTSQSATINFYNQAAFSSFNSLNDIFGLVVGSDTSSFSIEDYTLYNKITNGTGSGQLMYLSTDFSSVGQILESSSFSSTIYRTYLNMSGGPTIIGESGIYMQGTAVATEDNKKIMIARNPFPSHITLNHREAVQVSYKLIFTAI